MQNEAEKAPQKEAVNPDVKTDSVETESAKSHGTKHEHHHEKDKHKNHKGENLVKELEDKLSHMEKQYNEMLDTARRMKAEYENFKKRSEINYSEKLDNETSRIVKEFISVYDNLERACSAAGKSQSLEQFEKGVEMIVKQYKTTLDKFGVEEIGEVNTEFNPEIHEALMMRESDKATSETVVEIFEKGYKMRGKVIRHAKVIVENPAPKKQDNQEVKNETENNSTENSSGGQ